MSVYSSPIATTPSAKMPIAQTSPPWSTMTSAKMIAGIATTMRGARSDRRLGASRVRAATGYRPPKRRRRAAYSSSEASNASRVKSGQSSSRNTNSA